MPLSSGPKSVTLAARLLLAFGFVAILATALVGLPLRSAARQTIETDFHDRIEAAASSVQREFGREARTLGALLIPLCAKGTFVDEVRTQIDKARGDVTKIDAGKRSAWNTFVPSEAEALGFDELVLVTGKGFVLASTNKGSIGTIDERWATLVKSPAGWRVFLRTDAKGGAGWLEVHCSHADKDVEVGLVGARKVGSILERIGASYNVQLHSLTSKGLPKNTDRTVVRAIDVAEVPGMRVVLTASKDSLNAAQSSLDRAVLFSGAVALAIALGVAVVLARSLSRPIVELARETREVVVGEPHAVSERGGRELSEFARAYNRTISELAAMRKRLAATERISARREVARQVAHEIKNPLAPIRAAVETLRRLRARDDPAFDEYFEEASATVLQEVHRIANIVTEFTKFNRLPPPQPEPIDLIEVVKGVVTLHASAGDGVEKTGTKRVELKTEPIPLVNADRDQMVQVLTNLIQNGLDAASAIRPDPRVVVTIDKASEENVRIVVRDNGPGVPAEMLPRLFEPYATTKAKGTGLGLAIVHRMVFEHGGEIMYREATKGGAVFEILLPINGPTLLDKPPALEMTFRPDKGSS